MKKLLMLIGIVTAGLVVYGCGKGGDEESAAGSSEKGMSDFQTQNALANAGSPEDALAIAQKAGGAEGAAAGAATSSAAGGGASAAPAAAPALGGGLAAGGLGAPAAAAPGATPYEMPTGPEAEKLMALIPLLQPGSLPPKAYEPRKSDLTYPRFERVIRVINGHCIDLNDTAIVYLAGVASPVEGQPGYETARRVLTDLAYNRLVWVTSEEDRQVHAVAVRPYALAGEPRFIDINASMAANLKDLRRADDYYRLRARWNGPHLVTANDDVAAELAPRYAEVEAARAALAKAVASQADAQAAAEGGGGGATLPPIGAAPKAGG